MEEKFSKKQLSEVPCSIYDSAVSCSSTCSAWLTGAGEKAKQFRFFLFYFIPSYFTVDTIPHKGVVVRQRVPSFVSVCFSSQSQALQSMHEILSPCKSVRKLPLTLLKLQFHLRIHATTYQKPIADYSPKNLLCLCWYPRK